MSTDAKQENGKASPPKTRSPNYPSLNLKEAIEKAKLFFDRNNRHAAGVEAVASIWGVSAKSSTFKLQLAALRAFSLFENVDGDSQQVRLSGLGLDIIADYPEGSTNRKHAIQRAALSPGIHDELRTKYGPELPSDDEVRRYLVRDRGFNDRTVGDFIQEYKDTMAFAALDKADTIIPAGGTPKGAKPNDPPANDEKPRRRRDMPAGMKEDVFNLDRGQVVIQYPDSFSPESFEDFEGLLQLVLRKAKRSIRSGDEGEDNAGEEDA